MSEDELRHRLEKLEGKMARISELEAEVARLREDAASSRALASMADRDVAEMRTTMLGHTQVLNALRETQIEQGQTLQQHGRMLEQLAQVVGGLVVSTDQLQAGQGGMAEQLNRIEALLRGDGPREQ